MKNKFGLLAILICAGFAFAQENYSTWSGHMDVTINTTADTLNGGANVANAVTGFPTLVRLTSAQAAVFSGAAAGGADIRFTAADGTTRLAHQTERWDALNTLAEFWVLVPSIAGNATTTIKLHWGKSGVADSSNGAMVFDTANGFQAVYHMSKGDTTAENDATVNAFTMSEFNQPIDTLGVIGRTRRFNGTNQRFQAANTATSKLNFAMSDNYTLSAWMYAKAVSAATNDGDKIIDKGDNQYVLAHYDGTATKYWEITTRGNNSYLQSRSNGGTCATATPACTGASNGRPIFTAASLVGGWHHIVGTWTGNALVSGNALAESLYLDGTLMNGAGYTYASTTGRNLTYNVNIGVQAAGTAPGGTAFTRFWDGMLDEVSLSNKARSADWIKLAYATQKEGSTTVKLTSSAAAPSAPTNVAGTAGNGQVVVTWTAAASGGSTVTGYTVTSSPGSFTCTTTGGLTCTVTGLANGTGYTFTATATNAIGTSPASLASATVTPIAPVGVPDQPTIGAVTAGNAQATVNWTAATTGTAATGFTVTSSPDGKTCTTTGALTCIVTGLTNGTAYTFRVVATNAQGSSLASNPSASATPVGAPAAPSAALGAAGNAQVVVSWVTPASNGGSAITSYTATSSPESKTCTATGAATLTCTVTGLTNGTAYTFTVTATNAIGTSVASGPSAAVTPATVPGVPAITSVVGASGQVTVTWSAPTSNGGSAITGYTATASDTTKKCTTTGATTLTCIVMGLTNTTAYTFTVTASNAVGKSTPSAASASVTSIMSFERDLGLRISGSSMTMRLPEFSGNAEVSIVDVWGRVVWSKTVGEGVRELSLNKGSTLVPGVYIARLVLSDKNHKSGLAAESKILLTP